MRGTSLMWAPHVWCCVTDFSSLTALLEYLVTYNITAQSPSPDGKYQLIFNFIKSCQKSLDYAYLIPDRCVIARLCQQTRFIVPVESAGADRVPIVPEDSGSHRHRARGKNGIRLSLLTVKAALGRLCCCLNLRNYFETVKTMIYVILCSDLWYIYDIFYDIDIEINMNSDLDLFDGKKTINCCKQKHFILNYFEECRLHYITVYSVAISIYLKKNQN